MKTKVRFNLSKGKNFMKWKIEHSKGIIYLNPNEVFIKMINAKLKNRKSTAEKIKNGANKTVCSWVLCDDFDILSVENFNLKIDEEKQIRYNPKVNPFWTNKKGDNIDDSTYSILYTNNNKIFIL